MIDMRPPIDMRPAAVRARLRRAAELADLTTGERLRAKIDYSPDAVQRRLQQVDAARRLCLRLQGRLAKSTS